MATDQIKELKRQLVDIRIKLAVLENDERPIKIADYVRQVEVNALALQTIDLDMKASDVTASFQHYCQWRHAVTDVHDQCTKLNQYVSSGNPYDGGALHKSQKTRVHADHIIQLINIKEKQLLNEVG